MPSPLTFAVPKGRILDEALPVMARAGVVPEAAFHDKGSRALSFACDGGEGMPDGADQPLDPGAVPATCECDSDGDGVPDGEDPDDDGDGPVD